MNSSKDWTSSSNCNASSDNKIHSTARKFHFLEPQADYRSQTVISSDSCGSLVSKCQISINDFFRYNPQKNLCFILAPGQRIGYFGDLLPDIRPISNLNDLYFKYLVKSGDICSFTATVNRLKITDLSLSNDRTSRGWVGYDNLMVLPYRLLKVMPSVARPSQAPKLQLVTLRFKI